MPLVVDSQNVFPLTLLVVQSLYARSLIEIIAAFWLVALIWKLAPQPPRSWVLLAFAVYVAISMISAIWGVSFTRSMWSTYIRMVGVWDLFHWLLIVVVVTSIVGWIKWRTLINCNLAVALVLSLLALGQAYFYSGCRLHATVGHPSFLAAILLVTTLLAVGLLMQSFLRREGKGTIDSSTHSSSLQCSVQDPEDERHLVAWRIFWTVVAVLGIWVLLGTGTRGAVIGLVGGAVTMPLALVVWGNRRAMRPIMLAAGGILLTVVTLSALELTLGFGIGANC